MPVCKLNPRIFTGEATPIIIIGAIIGIGIIIIMTLPVSIPLFDSAPSFFFFVFAKALVSDSIRVVVCVCSLRVRAGATSGAMVAEIQAATGRLQPLPPDASTEVPWHATSASTSSLLTAHAPQ